MYRTTELPEDWAHVPRAWKQLHADYQYILWTDEQLRQLIADDYPWLLATYDAYPHDTQRWDASRFAILHKYGGVYADLDIQAVERIDALLEGQQLLLPHTPNVGLTNALMASVAEHPFMSEALRLLPAYAHAWYHLSKHNTVLSSTGSTYLWALYMRWPDTAESEPPALMQAHTWGKCSVCRPPTTQHDPDLPEGRPLFKHARGSSWHALDSTLLLFLFCKMELCTGLAVCAVGFIFLRSRLRASCLGCGALAVCWLVSALGINLFEALLCRPWIWLIMGRRD
jgi:mannosyltransferase OCH1-like enzyme